MKILEQKQATPTIELLTLAEVKEWLIVDHDQDDTKIQRLINAVTLVCQKRTKQLFGEHVVIVIAEVNRLKFYLPRLPLIDMLSITRLNTDGTFTILPTDEYRLLADDAIEFNEVGTYRIELEAGYTGENLPPDDIKIGALNEIAYRYENRGDETVKAGLTETCIQYLTPYINPHYLI